MKRYRYIQFPLTLILLTVGMTPTYAALTIEITKGIEAGIPVAVVPFEWKGGTPPPQEIADQGIDAIQNYFASLKETEDIDYLY